MGPITEEERQALRKKYFPRVEWTAEGPVRRRYLVRGTEPGADALSALTSLAEAEGFTEPGRRTVAGDGAACLEAFREKAAGAEIGMIFGTDTGAHWCDIALGPAEAEDWRKMLVRSEEGENLTALAHNLGLLRFRRGE